MLEPIFPVDISFDTHSKVVDISNAFGSFVKIKNPKFELLMNGLVELLGPCNMADMGKNHLLKYIMFALYYVEYAIEYAAEFQKFLH